MKVLVTGGNGFIGGYVCERLTALGHDAVVFDRSLGAIEGRDNPYGFQLGDVRDESAVFDAVYHADGVIHLAGILGTQETLAYPQSAIDVNITGSLNVFRACAMHRKKCVYITLGNHFMLNPYSISKSCAERLALMINREQGAEIAVVRGYNVYGPRQKTGPVRKIMPTMILAALQRKPITVYGDGAQIQDMIYVEDMADILCRALLIEHGVYGQIFEAGSGRQTSVSEIAHEITRQLGGEIVYKPMRPGETAGAVIVANPTTLIPLFPNASDTDAHGRIPFLPLRTGIEKTAAYYREQVAVERESIHA